MTRKRQRRPTTSVKAILVRNFNWRMGNLRRIEMSVLALDDDLKVQVQELVHMQMDREQFRHEGDLMALLSGNPGGWRSRTLDEAVRVAENCKAWREQLDG